MFHRVYTGRWSFVSRRWRIANCSLASLVSVTVGCPSSRTSLSDRSLTGSLRGWVTQSLSWKCIQLHWAVHPRRCAVRSSTFETTVLKSRNLCQLFKKLKTHQPLSSTSSTHQLFDINCFSMSNKSFYLLLLLLLLLLILLLLFFIKIDQVSNENKRERERKR